ncbi:MAG: hypothetical protein JNK89_06580 [Saprospiraceae bacterium]|nr:hypothetical protein [Saprospiraceae bacterium]
MRTLPLSSVLFFLLLWSASLTQAQVSGKITVNKDFYDALKAQHGANLLKTALQLEVWSVRYLDVRVDQSGQKAPVTAIFLQEKWSGASIPLTAEVVGSTVNLKFTIKNLPLSVKGGTKYALVYHLSAYPDQYKTVRFDEKGNDGSGRTGLRYMANFSATLGEKQATGLMSLSSSATQTYTINLFSSTQIVAFGLLDDILDAVGNFFEVVWEGGKSLAGVFVDAAGTIFTQAFGIGQSLFLDDGVIIPRYREMSAAEYAFVTSKIFGNTLPPRDKIIITNLRGFEVREFVWPTGVGGTILMNLGKKGYDNPMGVLGRYATNETPGQVFIHETTHVWQIHHSPDIQFTLQSIKNQVVNWAQEEFGDGSQIYQFDCTTGTPWGDFNLEQQARIVEFCFVKREHPTTPFSTYCEEPLVVANIRNGLAFRTAACQQLIDQIRLKRRAIQDRINALKVAWLVEQGETVVQNADGTIKVGADKGIDSVNPPSSYMNSDSQLNQLKAELAVLEQRQRDTNCY